MELYIGMYSSLPPPHYPWSMCSKTPQWMPESMDSTKPYIYCFLLCIHLNEALSGFSSISEFPSTLLLCFGAVIKQNKGNTSTVKPWQLIWSQRRLQSDYRRGAYNNVDTLDKGVIPRCDRVGRPWDFTKPLREACNIKLITVYFYNFLFNLVGPRLTMGNWNCGKRNHGKGGLLYSFWVWLLSLTCESHLFSHVVGVH